MATECAAFPLARRQLESPFALAATLGPSLPLQARLETVGRDLGSPNWFGKQPCAKFECVLAQD
jgi:hypothetical protein